MGDSPSAVRTSPCDSGGAACKTCAFVASRIVEQASKTGKRLMSCIFVVGIPVFSPEARKRVSYSSANAEIRSQSNSSSSDDSAGFYARLLNWKGCEKWGHGSFSVKPRPNGVIDQECPERGSEYNSR